MQDKRDSEKMWPLVRQHPRTQAEVARSFFANVPTGAAVIYPAIVITAWVYHSTIDHAWLYSALAVLAVLQLVILLHWQAYRRQVQAREAQGQWDWSVAQLKITSALSIAKAVCISMLGWMIAHPGLGSSPQVASVMVLIYLLGATVAHFIYRPAVIRYPIVLLFPLGILNALSGNPEQWAIAGFFAFYFLGAFGYISGHSKQLQLSIYQRFQLDELARKLEGESARAQAALDAKARFFAATSHDVRQPLQAMSIMLDALRAHGEEPQQRERLLHDLDVNMDALRALFDQVLEVTRLEAGTVLLQPRPVSLAELFARLHSRFELLASGKNVSLKLAATQAWVTADPLALERMVANLIGNALKHTPVGGVIWVGWRAQRSRLEVRDSGVGIALDQQQRIFDEFYQVGTQKDHAQGLGLGLAIVRRLAALGRQRVGVRSQPGRGSVFWIGMQHAQASSAPSTSSHARLAAHEAEQPEASHASRGRLLYVENDETLLRVTSSLLRMNGWQLSTCSSAEEAMQLLKEEANFSLLLTDFRMGDGWDGAQLIEAARGLPGYAQLPAIVMTGDGAVAEQASFTRLQAAPGERHAAITRLLHKPVKTAHLLETIEDCLQATEQV